jgi:ribosomal protein S18 acetylase RimI-like enzyme
MDCGGCHGKLGITSLVENGVSGAESAERQAIDGVTLRAFAPADLAAAHALSEEVGWPHRLVDWEFALALGEGLIAERDSETVGTAFAWKWGARHATLGLVIVAPRCQGRRIGQRLMSGLLERLHRRTILLHATPEGRGLYERLGFVQIGEIRQHQGQALQAPLEALEPGTRLRPASQRDTTRLIALDAAAGGMPRDPLVRRLLDSGGAVVLDRDGEARGFSVLRRFGRGHVIGPVVAPDPASARALIAHWANLHAGRFVRIDTDFACGLVEWLESLGLRRAGNPAAMVRGPALVRGPSARGRRADPAIAGARQYALVSQALG